MGNFILIKTKIEMAEETRGSKREKNPVADSLIWSDYIKKENALVQVYDKFTLNPASIKIVSDKPNIDNAIKAADKNPEFEQTIKTTFTNYFDVPKNKVKAPVTAAQEVGWTHDIPMPESFQNNRRVECHETAFAKNYSFMKGHSLYSNKNKL